jgi:uncharacterized protein (DUF2267 family)
VDFRGWVEEVAGRAGMTAPAQAERVIEATLHALRSGLDDADARAIAAELPQRFARILGRGTFKGELDEAALYERVRRREHVAPGFAREHAQVVCQVLAEQLSPAVLAAARKRTPVTVSLFEPRQQPAEPPAHVHRHPPSRSPAKHTLAAGRPGGTRPVSESREERAHSGSVVSSASPHAASKLSTTLGTTQERADRTLSTGAPPEPDRSVYRAR